MPDTSQDAVGLLGHLGTLLAHVQPAVDQHPQVLFHWAGFQPLLPNPAALHGVVVTQVQDPALGLVETHMTDFSPSIQPVQIPLQSLPTLEQIDTPTQLGIICKLTKAALNPLIQTIDKDVKPDWTQNKALANTTHDRPPAGFNSIRHHCLRSAIQPVLCPVKSTPIQTTGSWFLQEDTVGNSVKGLSKVQVDNILSLSLIHQVGHLVIGGDWVGQAGPAFHESMLAGPESLVVLHVPGEHTQDESLHNVPWHQGQADRPLVPRILLLAFLVDGCYTGDPPVTWDLPC